MAKGKAASRGLGKGLNALFGDEPATAPEKSGIVTLKLSSIEPNKGQPRKDFDKEKLMSLAESIKQHGIIQPLVVSENKNGYYTIIAGERRWRASRLAGITEVPVVIKNYEESTVLEVALVENLQREDLNPIEEAMGYKELMDEFSYTQEKVSEKVGKSRSVVANSLRLLTLPDKIIKMIKSGELSSGHGRCIAGLTDKKLQISLAEETVKNQYSVRKLEALIKGLSNKKPKKEIDVNIKNAFLDAEEKLTSSLGTKVKISQGKKRGKIEIEYYSPEELERLIKLLG